MYGKLRLWLCLVYIFIASSMYIAATLEKEMGSIGVSIGIVAEDSAKAESGYFSNVITSGDLMNIGSDYINIVNLNQSVIKAVMNYVKNKDKGVIESNKDVGNKLKEVDYLIVIEKIEKGIKATVLNVKTWQTVANENFEYDDSSMKEDMIKRDIGEFLVDVFYNKIEWNAKVILKGKKLILDYVDPRAEAFGNVGLIKVRVAKDDEQFLSVFKAKINYDGKGKAEIPLGSEIGKIIMKAFNNDETVYIYVKPLNGPAFSIKDYSRNQFDKNLIFTGNLRVIETTNKLLKIKADEGSKFFIYRLDHERNFIRQIFSNEIPIGNSNIYLLVTNDEIETDIMINSLMYELKRVGNVFINYEVNSPPNSVKNLRIKNLSEKRYEVYWDESTDPDGKIKGYRIRVLSENQKEVFNDVVSDTKKEIDLSKWKHGKFTVEVRAIDDKNAEGPASTVEVLIKNHPPVIDVEEKEEVHVGDVLPLKVIDEDGDDIVKIKAHIENNILPITEEGIKIPSFVDRNKEVKIKVEARDSQGATSCKELTLRISNRSPKILMKDNLTVKNDKEYGIEVEDPDEDIVHVTYEILKEGKKVKEASGNLIKIKGIKPGSYTLMIYAKDDFGGSSYKKVNLTVENSPPIIQMPDVIKVKNGEKIELIAKDPDGDNIDWDYEIGEIEGGVTVLQKGKSTIALYGMKPGNKYKVKLTATDENNQSNYKEIVVEAEDSPPVISSVSGKERIKVGEYFVVSYKDVDNNVEAIEATVDGKRMRVEDNKIFIEGLRPEKEYVLHIRIVDKCGKYAEKEVSFYLEDTPPNLEIPETIVAKNNEVVEINAEDPDVDNLFYIVEIPKLNKEFKGSEFKPLFIKPGVYNAKITVQDRYGKSDSKEVKLIIKNTPPKVEEFVINTGYKLGYPTNPVKVKVKVYDPDGQDIFGTVFISCRSQCNQSDMRRPITLPFDEDVVYSTTISLDPPIKPGKYEFYVKVSDGTNSFETVKKEIRIYDIPKVSLTYRRHENTLVVSIKREDLFKDAPMKVLVEVVKDDNIIQSFATWNLEFNLKLEEAGYYRIKVTPLKDGVKGETKEISYYYKGRPPKKPVILFPKDDSTLPGNTVSIKWRYDRRYTYKIYLGKNGQELKMIADNLKLGIYKLNLEPGNYKLKVVAYDSIGRYTESDVVSFSMVGHLNLVKSYSFDENIVLFEYKDDIYASAEDSMFKLDGNERIEYMFYPTDIVPLGNVLIAYNRKYGSVFVYDGENGVNVELGRRIDSVTAGKYIYAISRNIIYVIDFDGEIVNQYICNLGNRPKAVNISGHIVFTTGKPGIIYVFDEENLEVIKKVLEKNDDMAYISYDPVTKILVSIDSLGTIRYYVFDSNKFNLKQIGSESDVPTNGVLYLKVHGGKVFIQIVDDYKLYMLDINKRKVESKISLRGKVYNTFISNGKLMVVGDYFLSLYDISSGFKMLTYKNMNNDIVSSVFQCEKDLLYISDSAGNVFVYKIR